MKTLAPILVSMVLAGSVYAQEQPWQKISDPIAAQLAANFAAPPSEYSSQFDWGFSDKLTCESMAAILDHAKSLGVTGAFVEPKPGDTPWAFGPCIPARSGSCPPKLHSQFCPASSS